ncbi:MAG: 3'(2'),5'-bisphosphate nucleotidase [bacterium]|nr:3'(2'),5'-bisphosphate nucleotidase [bacterium]
MYEHEKRVAVEAALEAARVCVAVQQGMVGTMEKEDKSPVTVADFGSQALVCRRLKEHFPDDPIVAEEDASDLRKGGQNGMVAQICSYVASVQDGVNPETLCDWIDLGNGSVANRFWTLDPIDGTKGFLRKEQYAVALALIEAGQVKVGVLVCPSMPVDMEAETGDCGVLFVAVRGEGTQVGRLKDKGLVSAGVVKEQGGISWRFVESVEASHSDQDHQGAIARSVGIQAPSLRMDSQTKYGAVARGDAVLYLRLPSPKYPDYREKIWDHAAGSLVVEESGGKVTDMHGKPLDLSSSHLMMENRGVVVSNGEIHEDVIAALAGRDTSGDDCAEL